MLNATYDKLLNSSVTVKVVYFNCHWFELIAVTVKIGLYSLPVYDTENHTEQP